MKPETLIKVAAASKLLAEKHAAVDWKGLLNSGMDAAGNGLNAVKEYAQANPRIMATLATGGLGAGLGYGAHLMSRGIRGASQREPGKALMSMLLGGTAGAGLANGDMLGQLGGRLQQVTQPVTNKIQSEFGVPGPKKGLLPPGLDNMIIAKHPGA